uniref:Tubulin delta chain n=2 Tax=Physcomitrium patens TaxID=3218 RepID=A0A2K1IIR6_PHYPA|nr:hypothetical protein PHYPA_027863 [Physcomitrium patens]
MQSSFLNFTSFKKAANRLLSRMESSSASCVVVQLGQGGNQLYTSFFTALANLSNPTMQNSGFFREGTKGGRVARAVLIDMEPKVEACDMFGGFLTAQSMAGGTGSGLGAYVTELLKDEYPSKCVLSHCIWPYESGEVIVQNYNALLTLAKLQESADGIIISQNDALSSICRKTLGIPRSSFDHMNDVVANSLASIFLPASWRTVCPSERNEHPRKTFRDKGQYEDEDGIKGGIYGAGMPVRLLSDLVSKLCAHPGYRMLSLRFTPQISNKSLNFTTFNWGAQIKQLQQMLMTEALGDFDLDLILPSAKKDTLLGSKVSRFGNTPNVNRCLANMLVLRGSGSLTADVSRFEHESLYPVWSVDHLSVAVNPAKLGKYEMSAGLLCNCQSTVMCTFRALSRAYGMFASRAYLHQYFKFGMEISTFEEAFTTVEDIISRYLAL